MAGEDEDYGSARITIDLDDAGVVADARDLGLRIKRALDRATRDAGEAIRRNIQRGLDAAAVSVRVEPDLRRFGGQLVDGLRSFESLNLPVVPDLTGFVERIRALLAGEEVSIRVVPDLSDFDAQIRRHNPPDVGVNVNPDVDRFRRALAGLTRVAGAVGKALTGLLAFGAVGIAAAGAATAVGAFTAAVAPAGGAVAALPAALLGAAAAMNVLKLGLQGVSEALGKALEGDMEKFAEELEKLAPAAQKAIGPLGKQLRSLQQSLQQSLFKQFAGDVQGAVKNLSPLGKQLDGIAAEFGKATSAGLKWLATPFARTNLSAVFTGTQEALGGLTKAITPVLQGFTDVAAQVSLAFGEKTGSAIAKAGKRFGDYLTGLAESGEAVQKVSAAVTVFRQLREIAGNVKDALSGVFQAGESAGAGLLDRLTKITAKVAEFTNSTAGQAAIGNIFAAVGTVGAQLLPILEAVVTQVGEIAPALQPIFTALGPAIVGVINSIGPALAAIAPAVAQVAQGLAGAFEAVGPALGPLGAAIGQILAALAPLLPVVGQLAGSLASALAPVLGQIAPLLAPVVAAFRQVVPVVGQLASTVAGVLGPVLAALVPAVSQLLGPVVSLAKSLGQALMPVISALGPIIAALVPALLQVFLAFNPVLNVIVNLGPLLMPIIGLVAQLVAWFLRLITPLVQLIAPIATMIAQFFAINRAIGVVIGWIGRLVGWFGRMWTALSTAASRIGTGITQIVGFFLRLNARVTAFITSLAARVPAMFTGLISRAASAVSAGVSRIVGIFSGLWGRLSGTLSGLGVRVVSFFRGLQSRITGALSRAGSALAAVGRDMIRGLLGGIRAMAGEVASTARRVVSGAVTAAKNALGISSPSKVFRQIGRDTGRGFIAGLTGTAAQIKATTDKVAKSIIRAFEGRRTRLDDRLVAMVDAGNKKLQKLAAQRDSLAKKIGDAQKFAAETTKAAIEAFSLSNLTQGQEAFTAKTITAGLEDAVRQVNAFSADLNKLARKGLRKDLLAQIIGLGPQQGAQIADVLANSTKDSLKRINSLQGQLAKASGVLGNTSADVLYDAGQQAGKGFLAGLKGQRKSIEKLMLDIARGMQSAIRTALRIKSPSRVMMHIGDMTGAGLHLGLLKRLGMLEAASRDAARSLADGVRGQLAGMGAGVDDLGAFALTRAQRTRQTRDDGGGRTGAAVGKSVVHNHHWEIREVGNAHVTAQRVLSRFVLAAGVSG